jgi:hypothetical protein
MAWDWTVRIVLPVLLATLALIVCDIVEGTAAGFTMLDGVSLALLMAAMLGLGAWWAAAWLPLPGAVPNDRRDQEGDSPRREADSTATVPSLARSRGDTISCSLSVSSAACRARR